MERRRRIKKRNIIYNNKNFKILNKDKDLKIAFWDNCLCERGTTVSIYDYAYYNEKLLDNKSIIFYDTTHRNNNKSIIKKFQDKFKVYGVDNFNKIDNIIEKENIDILYVIKSGELDGKISNSCNTVVHCVFNANFKHGKVYSTIHPDVTGNNGQYPVVPHMINLPSNDENLRDILNIPKKAKVFGGYGGKDSFDIPFVHKAIYKIAKENPNIYFIFANFKPFCQELKNIIYLPTIYDLEEKVKFINTCNAMIWGRDVGETFGISIGEFSINNKPIIATKNVRDRGHVNLLGSKALWYNNEKDLTNILLNFDPEKESKKDWNAYKEYTPEKVMKIFKEIFIKPFVKNMELEYVLTSCNTNKLYSDFIPIFIRAWKKLIPAIKIKIILIADEIPEEYRDYEKYLILFKPLENITTSFTSQYIRLLYPALLKSNDGVLITDIDMIPMNKDYYTEYIKNIDKNKFIYYKDYIYPTPKQYMMCYHIATSKTWSEVFNINSIEDIETRLKERFTDFWCRDQEDLYIYINNWNKKDTHFVMLNDSITRYKRLCRASFPKLDNVLFDNINKGIYTDYHMLRPNEGKNKEINEKIVDCL